METLIKVENISKNYLVNGKSQKVLDDINFEISKNEFTCIIGPSGCGKSTLLRIIANLIKATGGSVKMDSGLKLAMVFQNFALFPWLSVEQNIGYGLFMKGEDRQKIKKEVSKQIDEMGLAGVENKHPKELSGGMKQRVGIARALAIAPDILLLDEPFSALDAFTADKLRKDLLSIWQEKHLTVIMVSHLIEEAVELADKIIVLSSNPGKIQSIDEIALSRPRNTRNSAFFEWVDRLTGRITV